MEPTTYKLGNTAKQEAIEGRRGAIVSYLEALEKQTFPETLNRGGHKGL